MENKNILVYPAIFEKEGNKYNVTFPDIPEAITCGESIENAEEMAQSALGLALYETTDFPKASNPKNMKVSKDCFISMIELDIVEYRSQNHS